MRVQRPFFGLFRTMQPIQPGEAKADFGPYFTIKKLVDRTSPGCLADDTVYLMKRKPCQKWLRFAA